MNLLNKILCLLLLPALFSCVKHPITDEQAKIIAELCDKRGGTVSAFNTGAVSRIDCSKGGE